MKKKYICMIAASAAALIVLTGCGASSSSDTAVAEDAGTQTGTKEEVTSSAGEMGEINAADYVTLGEYKGLGVDFDAEDPTDEEVDEQINRNLASRATEKQVTGRPVKTGDIVNIDYVGKKDGIAFDGGTSPDGGYDLTIGSGQFISGFEDGLIGAEIGQTLDLNLTFPENYGSAELAGADVVFTVTVNSITEKVVPELTDALVADIDDTCKTVADYKNKVKDGMISERRTAAVNSAKESLLNRAIDNSQFKEIPDSIIDEQAAFRKKDAERYAQNYGTSLEIFVTQGLGETMEEFEKECREYAQESAKEMLVIYAIAQAEGIQLTEEEARAEAEPYLASFQVTSFEDLKNTDDGKYFIQFLQADKVTEWLFDNATLNE